MDSMKALRLGLLGRGIGPSRSPRIHESEAAFHGLDLTYQLIDFTRLQLGDADLAAAIKLLRATDFVGCNVTFPFKQAVIGCCDELSFAAKALGAVNTLVFDADSVRGDNTDWIGFSWLIEREIGAIAGASIAQIGAGGAGSATAFALAQSGAREVAVFDPDQIRAEELAARLNEHFDTCSFEVCTSAEAAISGREGIVNATPVGMSAIPGTPFDPALLTSEQWVADIIYFPIETKLLKAAKQAGCRVANGVSMVVGQAAVAFQLFTGREPDRERMLERLNQEIAADFPEGVAG